MRTDIPGTVLPEWLQTFRKDFKEAVSAADNCKQDAKKSASTQPLKKQEGQQLAASGETISTVEQTQAGQQHAATVQTISTEDANQNVPMAENEDKPAEEVKPVVASGWLKMGSIVVGSATKWKDKYDGVKCKVLDLIA